MDQPETVAHFRCHRCVRTTLREGGQTVAHTHAIRNHGMPGGYDIVLLPPTVLPEPLPYEVPYDAG